MDLVPLLENDKQYITRSSFLNKLFLWDAIYYLRIGKEKAIELTQIRALDENLQTEYLHKRFSKALEKYTFKKALFQTFKLDIIKIQLINIFLAVSQLMVPIIIQRLLNFIQSEEKDLTAGAVLLIFLIISRFITLFCYAHAKVLINLTGYNATSVIQQELYQKMLKVSFLNNKQFSQGYVINLMQIDAAKISSNIYQISGIQKYPFQIIFGLILAYYIIGVAFVGGVLALVFTGIVNSLLSKYYSHYQSEIMKAKDIRIKDTNEALTQIKFIKINAFEQLFTRKLELLRKIELKQQYLKQIIFSFTIFFGWFCPAFIQIATFSIYIYLGNTLNVSDTFAIISIFSMLDDPLMALPNSINCLIQAVISLNRCAKFLDSPELKLDCIKIVNDPLHSIIIENGQMGWNILNDDQQINIEKNSNSTRQIAIEDQDKLWQEKEQIIILRDINIKIKKGQLTIIIGDVGSGKSSLFQAILGEMNYDLSTQIKLNGNIAYVGQKSWIMNETIKQNILFGKNYEEKRYNEAIKYSCLEDDLRIFQFADDTIIGEKGVNLSGGQKARISLARAIYSQNEILLLDDPISAVDGHVGNYIMKTCIKEYLDERTRILITHALNNCQFADKIVLMDNGYILGEGSYQNMLQMEQFQILMQKYNNHQIQHDEDEELIEEQVLKIEKKQQSYSQDFGDNINTEQIMTVEEKLDGSLQQSVLNAFYEANGQFMGFFMTFILQIIGISLQAISIIWLGYWSENKLMESNIYYLKILIYLSFGQAAFAFLRNHSLSIQNVMASKKLHSKMLRIFEAPLCSFFERVPLGRILNRFTKDLDVIDSELYPNLSYFYVIAALCLSNIFLILYSSTLYLIIPIVIFFGICFKIQRYYMKTSREIYRIEAISRSPVLSYFSESISGVTYIRAYQMQQTFISEQINRQDVNRNVFYARNLISSWFLLILGLTSYIINIAAIVFCMFYGYENPSKAGIILVFAAQLDRDVADTIEVSSSIENNLISFERCLEYNTINVENNKSSKIIPSFWPQQGLVEFKNYSVRYRDNLPFALKNLNFTIQNGEKIGVVGRTGAGKSTLTMALLRLIEAQQGSIFIDGVDIADISLTELRSRLTMIMQESTIFRGTLRMNLDPLNQKSDLDIISAAESCCLDSLIEKGLNSELQENGSNLSAGEKQLICITRAVLKKSKIILIDEATANIDIQTERKIQSTILSVFKECTVITIAHRINTILHCDKILVIDEGEMREFGETKQLLQQKESLFYNIYSQQLQRENLTKENEDL